MLYTRDWCQCTLWKCHDVMVVDWGPHDVSEAFYRMWMVCALVCRQLELTVWVM